MIDEYSEKAVQEKYKRLVKMCGNIITLYAFHDADHRAVRRAFLADMRDLINQFLDSQGGCEDKKI